MVPGLGALGFVETYVDGVPPGKPQLKPDIVPPAAQKIEVAVRLPPAHIVVADGVIETFNGTSLSFMVSGLEESQPQTVFKNNFISYCPSWLKRMDGLSDVESVGAI